MMKMDLNVTYKAGIRGCGLPSTVVSRDNAVADGGEEDRQDAV
jgi:hypothetical protein